MAKKEKSFQKRHDRCFHFLKWLVAPYFRRKFAFRSDIIPRIDGPCIVLANHNTDLDPVLISLVYHKLMCFVTSEHVMRAGLASKLLVYLFDPIARIKGSVASSTVMQILRRLREGCTVCMFAEGNRSFDGNTCAILPATAKLVKSSGATLITYRFTGGYFSSPRWSTTLRRGKLTGETVGVYTPDVLKSMSTDEIYAIICNDLRENAYERQAVERVPYHGKKLAEALETMLFLCPRCGKIGTLQSHDDHLTCDCGLDVTYSELGYLSLPDMNTIPKWDAWQTRRFLEMTDENPSFSITDGDVILSCTSENHMVDKLYTGNIRMNRKALCFGDTEFSIADMVSLALYGKNSIVFTVGDKHYEVKSKTRFCARKYLLWFSHLKAQQVS